VDFYLFIFSENKKNVPDHRIGRNIIITPA